MIDHSRKLTLLILKYSDDKNVLHRKFEVDTEHSADLFYLHQIFPQTHLLIKQLSLSLQSRNYGVKYTFNKFN